MQPGTSSSSSAAQQSKNSSSSSSGADSAGNLQEAKSETDAPKLKEGQVVLSGLVSTPGRGIGKASGDRQFVLLNGRPVDAPWLIQAA